MWTVWNTLYHTSFMLDKNRQGLSAVTIVFWSAALYLSTAYTTLLTPTNIIVQETMRGTELDFSANAFWDWVGSPRIFENESAREGQRLHSITTSTQTGISIGPSWAAPGGHITTARAR